MSREKDMLAERIARMKAGRLEVHEQITLSKVKSALIAAYLKHVAKDTIVPRVPQLLCIDAMLRVKTLGSALGELVLIKASSHVWNKGQERTLQTFIAGLDRELSLRWKEGRFE